MEPLEVLREASGRIYKSVRDLAGTAGAGGDFGRGAGGDISKKIDIVAETAVLDYLQEVQFPCVVLGEECGRIQLADESAGYIIMDAIDGTANAVRGFPFYCSSLAFATGNSLSSIRAGVVCNLYNGQTYWASSGDGAFLDGRPIWAGRGESGYSIIGVNVSGATTEQLEQLQPLLDGSHVRHMGANALEMAVFASGLMDAFVDLRCKIRIQDIAAGYILVHESGGLLLDAEMNVLDADLGYDTRVSFIAAADQDMANTVATMIGYGALGGI